MIQAYLVRGRMTVKAENDSLRLTSPEMEVAYAKSMVEGYFFQQDSNMPTDIEDIAQKGISVRYINDDRVEINGIATNTAIRIYGINGMEYNNCSESVGDVIIISLKSLPPSTYIIKIEGLPPFKVLRR